MNTHKTIAILGGTFDPIHNGHILPAKHVAQWLNVDQIRLMPAHIPPHKNNVVASAQQRADMVKLACLNEPLFVCDERELNRNQYSYTVDTLKEIKNEQPNSTLFFIIGMDSLLTFTQWRNWQEILTLCHLVVNCRSDYPLVNINEATNALIEQYTPPDNSQANAMNTSAGYIFFAPEIAYPISSTLIRDNIQAHSSCQGLLPDNVLNYIEQQQLYL